MSFDLAVKNNDLSINPDGSLSTVRDNYKLAQDVIKILITPMGSNRFSRWYGSSLSAEFVGSNLPISIVQTEAERSIQNSLSNLIVLQNEQAKNQYVSAGETIAAIREVIVIQNPYDPRQYQIMVSILTRKLNVVEETFTLTV